MHIAKNRNIFRNKKNDQDCKTMSQATSFYSINAINFKMLSENPETELSTIAGDQITLEQNHEGLLFLLSKIKPQFADLIFSFFYPATSVGTEMDFENIDLENLPEDFDFSSSAIYYSNPDEVSAFEGVLMEITDEDIAGNYAADELNEEGIYPGVWHNSPNPEEAFNALHLLEGFGFLKDFVQKAASEEAYVLAITG